MAWFGSMRAVVYLKRIAIALERIAAFAEYQAPQKPRMSRRGELSSEDKMDLLKPTVKDWNERYREENPDIVREEY